MLLWIYYDFYRRRVVAVKAGFQVVAWFGWRLGFSRSEEPIFFFWLLFFCTKGVFLALWRNFCICEEQLCVGGCGVSWTPSNWILFANTRQLGSRICYGFMVLGLVEGRVCLQFEGKFLALWHNFWICEEQICAVGGCGFSWTSSNWIQFASARELGSRIASWQWSHFLDQASKPHNGERASTSSPSSCAYGFIMMWLVHYDRKRLWPPPEVC